MVFVGLASRLEITKRENKMPQVVNARYGCGVSLFASEDAGKNEQINSLTFFY